MTKSEFKRILQKSRNAYIKADKITQELFDKLDEDMGLREFVLEDIPCNAENADNIKDAICGYLQYGEYDADLLWDDLIMGANAHS